MPAPRLTRCLAAALCAAWIHASPATSAGTAPTPAPWAESAPADTLFGPVAAQHAARLELVAKLAPGLVRPADIHALLDAGQVDRAASLVRRAHGAAREVAEARLRVALTRQDYDRSLAKLRESVGLEATPDGLLALAETLIRLGRTDDAITAAQWAARLDPYHDGAHYLLGNGYARRSYTELFAAYAGAFA